MRIEATLIEEQKFPHNFSGYNSLGDDFAGSFGTKENPFGFELEDIGRASEGIFRFHTDRTRITGLSPLIKINYERSMAYFLTSRAWETGIEEFEKRGVQMTCLNAMPVIAQYL